MVAAAEMFVGKAIQRAVVVANNVVLINFGQRLLLHHLLPQEIDGVVVLLWLTFPKQLRPILDLEVIDIGIRTTRLSPLQVATLSARAYL